MAGELDQFPKTGRFLMGRLRHAMSPDERRLMEGLVGNEQKLEDGAILARRGVLCGSSTMLVSGFAVRVIERDGRRHIVGIQVPGDFIDLHGFALKRLDHDIFALGRITVAQADHPAIRGLIETHPRVARLLWFSTLLDAAVHREWVLKLEQLPAPKRAAHVFCELWHRLEMVGLAESDGFAVPLTQIELASMCGATPVHMSRALRDLRERGLATFRNGRLTCPDREALERHCEFDPSYLYGPGELRVDSDEFF